MDGQSTTFSFLPARLFPAGLGPRVLGYISSGTGDIGRLIGTRLLPSIRKTTRQLWDKKKRESDGGINRLFFDRFPACAMAGSDFGFPSNVTVC